MEPFTLSLSQGFDKLSPNGIQDIPRPNQDDMTSPGFDDCPGRPAGRAGPLASGRPGRLQRGPGSAAPEAI
ncbi:MAG TPA: hypothetical protein PLI80_10690, partial [Ottowia sp.]|nr:hypothetical protein [Ottowia sp.]